VSELDDYGCEFYAGDADTIGRACAEWQFKALRDGRGARAFVGFPKCVFPVTFIFLSEAIAQTSGESEVALQEYGRNVALLDGIWSADVMPEPWVGAVAGGLSRVKPIVRVWRQLLDAEYGSDPDWTSPAVRTALARLMVMCGDAAVAKDDVVMVWSW
jgi:hypothetical protein